MSTCDNQPKKYKLGKKRRLRSNNRFREIIGKKLYAYTDELIIFADENTLPYSRAGFSVGKRFGNAVKRNRMKRLLREAFRQCEQVPDGWDFVIMYNQKLAGKSKNQGLKIPYSQISDSLRCAMVKFNNRIKTN